MKYGSKRGLLRALAKTDTMTTQKGVFARSGVTTE